MNIIKKYHLNRSKYIKKGKATKEINNSKYSTLIFNKLKIFQVKTLKKGKNNLLKN